MKWAKLGLGLSGGGAPSHDLVIEDWRIEVCIINKLDMQGKLHKDLELCISVSIGAPRPTQPLHG